jgi:hypothetical protein
MANKRQKEQRRKIAYTNASEVAKKQKSGFTSPALKLPEGVPLLSFDKVGKIQFNILPYVAGKGNSHADEGQVHFERTYFTHKLGAEGSTPYTCLNRTFGKKCPVCERVAELTAKGADKATIDALRAKQRQLFLVDVLDAEKPNQLNLHILETGYWKWFGQDLDNYIENSDEDSPRRTHFHLDKGQTVKASVIEDSFMGKNFKKIGAFEMVDRKKNYTEEQLEEFPCLDEIPVELSYAKLLEILDQGGNDAEEETEKPSTRKPAKSSSEDDDETDPDDVDSDDDTEETDSENSEFAVGDLVTYKGKECEIKKISPDGTSLTLEDNKKKIIKAVDPDECSLITGPDDDDEAEIEDDELDSDEDDEEIEEEEELPKKKTPAKKGKMEVEEEEEESDELEDEDSENDDELDVDEDDLDDDEEIEEEEEPAPKKKRGR